MNTEGFALVSVVLFCLFWLTGFSSGIAAGIYLINIQKHWKPGKEWGKYLGFPVFFSSFFTKQGNKFRTQLVYAILIFILSFVGGIGMGFWNESFTTSNT